MSSLINIHCRNNQHNLNHDINIESFKIRFIQKEICLHYGRQFYVDYQTESGANFVAFKTKIRHCIVNIENRTHLSFLPMAINMYYE